MRKLNALPDRPFGFFESIVSAKDDLRGQRLSMMKPRVELLYESYLTSVAGLATLQPAHLTVHEADDLRHCYTGSTKPLEDLKNRIDLHIKKADPVAAAICQYCGLTHAPETYDHYLPKEDFPEFSTHARNLVPSCERCNCLKGRKWLDSNGARRVLSLYFDALPSKSFLFASVVADPRPSAEFRLSNDAGDFEGLESVVRNHFLELDLLNRFNKAASAEFEEKRNEIGGEVRAVGVAAGEAMLRKIATRTTLTYSPNYWKSALFRAMAENLEFIAWCGR